MFYCHEGLIELIIREKECIALSYFCATQYKPMHCNSIVITKDSLKIFNFKFLNNMKKNLHKG